jgi:hypothetical protein
VSTGHLDERLLAERFAAIENVFDDSDWVDVRRRVPRRRPYGRIAAAAAAALLVALAAIRVAHGGDGSPTGRPAAASRVDGLDGYALGDVLHVDGKTVKLARPVFGPLDGNDRPVQRAGDVVVYSAWVSGTPMLRSHDLAADTDRRLAVGAYSFALAPDGRLAYLQRVKSRFVGTPHPAAVMVRPSADGAAVQWLPALGKPDVGTSVVGWAGPRLLVQRTSSDLRRLLVVDGPGSVRVLDGELVAVSADGGSALLLPGSAGGAQSVREVDLATGAVRARLGLDGARATGGGAAAGWAALLQSPAAILRVATGQIQVERWLRLAADPLFADADHAPAIRQLHALDGASSRIAFSASFTTGNETRYHSVLVVCTTQPFACRRGTQESRRPQEWLVWVR